MSSENILKGPEELMRSKEWMKIHLQNIAKLYSPHSRFIFVDEVGEDMEKQTPNCFERISVWTIECLY